MRVHENARLPASAIRISIADMMALRVRTAGTGAPVPRLLYQELPESGMTLMATIPRGTPAVSIPQQNGIYPVLNAPRAKTDCIQLVYARKPNNRYEAVEVLYGDRSFSIDQFMEFAERWVAKNEGVIEAVPNRHAYLAPSRDQWEIILRDGGYTVVDPSAMVFDINAEIRERRKHASSSGVIARVPVRAGGRPPQEKLFPSFEQIELTLDADPNPNSPWVDFNAFQRERAMQSRPPEPMISAFREWAQLLARESGFKCWMFRRGMFCGDHIEWWGHKNRRRTLHEGIDFAEGSLPDGSVGGIPDGTPVRALADGEAVAILDDYLNKTVVIRHRSIQNETGAVFHILFSHIHPTVKIPGPVCKGQLLGNVGKAKKSGSPAHLHLTGAWIPASIASTELTMDLIHPAFMPIVLINLNSLATSG